MIKLMACEDHEAIQKGLGGILGDNIEIIAMTDNGDECSKLFRQHQPDVVLLDLKIKGRWGLFVAWELLRLDPPAKIVIFSGFMNSIYVKTLYDLGVLGFVHKESSTDKLVEAINRAHSGKQYFSEGLVDFLKEKSPFDQLSKKEKLVCLSLAEKNKVEEIADAMNVEKVTIYAHKRRAFEKLGIESMDDLYALGKKSDLY